MKSDFSERLMNCFSNDLVYKNKSWKEFILDILNELNTISKLKFNLNNSSYKVDFNFTELLKNLPGEPIAAYEPKASVFLFSEELINSVGLTESQVVALVIHEYSHFLFHVLNPDESELVKSKKLVKHNILYHTYRIALQALIKKSVDDSKLDYVGFSMTDNKFDVDILVKLINSTIDRNKVRDIRPAEVLDPVKLRESLLEEIESGREFIRVPNT